MDKYNSISDIESKATKAKYYIPVFPVDEYEGFTFSLDGDVLVEELNFKEVDLSSTQGMKDAIDTLYNKKFSFGGSKGGFIKTNIPSTYAYVWGGYLHFVHKPLYTKGYRLSDEDSSFLIESKTPGHLKKDALLVYNSIPPIQSTGQNRYQLKNINDVPEGSTSAFNLYEHAILEYVDWVEGTAKVAAEKNKRRVVKQRVIKYATDILSKHTSDELEKNNINIGEIRDILNKLKDTPHTDLSDDDIFGSKQIIDKVKEVLQPSKYKKHKSLPKDKVPNKLLDVEPDKRTKKSSPVSNEVSNVSVQSNEYVEEPLNGEILDKDIASTTPEKEKTGILEYKLYLFSSKTEYDDKIEFKFNTGGEYITDVSSVVSEKELEPISDYITSIFKSVIIKNKGTISLIEFRKFLSSMNGLLERVNCNISEKVPILNSFDTSIPIKPISIPSVPDRPDEIDNIDDMGYEDSYGEGYETVLDEDALKNNLQELDTSNNSEKVVITDENINNDLLDNQDAVESAVEETILTIENENINPDIQDTHSFVLYDYNISTRIGLINLEYNSDKKIYIGATSVEFDQGGTHKGFMVLRELKEIIYDGIEDSFTAIKQEYIEGSIDKGQVFKGLYKNQIDRLFNKFKKSVNSQTDLNIDILPSEYASRYFSKSSRTIYSLLKNKLFLSSCNLVGVSLPSLIHISLFSFRRDI